mmetsp:Transcript_70323/g.186626  ORF Transcript_70323/g.186626 Transcript_70323/m.186626 type:complete len:545 (-) Transcript_70323:712-2346(-)
MAVPPPLEIILVHFRLGGAWSAYALHDGERQQELVQDMLGESEHELLATLCRERLGAGQIGEPVRKIKGKVLRRCLAGRNDALELPEEGSWGGLRLHQPAHVVLHLALRELDALLLLPGQGRVRREQARVVLENVRERSVVVVDHLADPVAPEGAVHVLPADGGQQLDRLHDVVDGRQHQHAQHAVLAVPARLPRLLGRQRQEAPLAGEGGGPRRRLIQKPSVHEQLLQRRPLGVPVEGAAALPLVQGRLAVVEWPGARLPVLVEPEAEGLAAVQVQAHEPEEREHGPQGALVLVLASPAAGHVAHEVQVHLREGGGDVLIEVFAGVVGVADLPGGPPRPPHVHLPPPHQDLQRRALGQRPPGRPGLSERGAVHVGDQEVPALLAHLRPPRLGGLVRHGRRAQHPRGGHVLRALPRPVHDGLIARARPLGGLPPGEGEVLAIGQADAVQGRCINLVHDDASGHLVDLVHCLNPRVRPRRPSLLALLVGLGVDGDAAQLRLWRHPKPLVEHGLDSLLPSLAPRRPHRQRAPPDRVVGLAPLDLRA